jgi:apolipoprotein N-acyltransferase
MFLIAEYYCNEVRGELMDRLPDNHREDAKPRGKKALAKINIDEYKASIDDGSEQPKRHPRLTCAVCGVLAGVVYYATALAFLTWFILIPVIYYLLSGAGDVLKAHRIKVSTMISIASSFAFSYFSVSYLVGFTIDVGFSKPAMLFIDLGLILLASLFQGIPQVAALVIGTRIPFPPHLRCLAIAAFWTFGEWLQTIGIFAFPVRTLASSQWKYMHFIQPAGVLGELFISFIIVLLATLIAQWLWHLFTTELIDEAAIEAQTSNSKKKSKYRKKYQPDLTPEQIAKAEIAGTQDPRAAMLALAARTGGSNKRSHSSYFALAILLFFIDAMFGIVWQSNIPEPLSSVQVFSVQPNTGMEEKNRPRFDVAIELAENALKDNPTESESRLVVFPESTAQYLLQDDYMQEKLSALAADYDTNIVVGGLNIVDGSGGATEESTDIVSIGKGEGKRENGVFFIDKEGELQSKFYTKQHMVPFFENGYLYPFKLLPGNERGIFKSDNGKIGAIICLESILPSVVRETVMQGANIIVVPTNDAYLSNEIKQMHFSKSVFRALETRRAIVQATTDGVTGVALPGGRYKQIGQNTAGVYVTELNMQDTETPFMKVGNAWIPALAGLCVLIALYAYLKRKNGGKGFKLRIPMPF